MYAGLQTPLALSGGKSITCDKSRKGPVDPASNEDHGKYVSNVSLHHVSQHTGICIQGVEQLLQ